MAKNLVIVESPTKAKTLSKFLGRNYKVMASIGHLRDLPKSKFGVDIEDNFEPQYINVRGKAKIINEIKKEASKAENVFLASDPDREGEAIAWHLAYILDLSLSDKNRVVFNEITKEAVLDAMKHPRKIDLNLVDAQQARRVLDRIVGYELSPILWKKVKSGLSAGRVQSVALKLIIDRENEIKDFIPKEYWSIIMDAKVDKQDFSAAYYGKYAKDKLEEVKISNEKEADTIINSLGKEYEVIDKNVSKRKRNPYQPFTTSTLQQEAAKRLYFTTSKTMSVAQQLYEGINVGSGSVGLITYMRTDSTRLSSSIIGESLAYIKENFGAKYASSGRSYSKKKSNSQDAHEAVRVSSINRTPQSIEKYLTKDQFKLYRLIWERTLQSQMKASEYLSTRYDIKNADHIFRANGSIIVFDGFTKVWSINDQTIELPDMEIGDKFSHEKIEKNQHFTKPKARYTEASLVKELEKNGIGRPSTYSSIIRSLLSRNYVNFEQKSLLPTEVGFKVNDLLQEYFEEVINKKFTADLENKLDSIEEDEIEWKVLISQFYDKFKPNLDNALKANKDEFAIKDKAINEKCPLCGHELLEKSGRNGKFIGCSNFPECKYTRSIVKSLGIKCPKDGGDIVEKVSKRGKIFYGCSNYPKCDWASWDKPTGEICDKCGDLMVHRKNRNTDAILCNNPDCETNK
ncbi:type I DNA topoisomerase [uncultured Helcococcus sp.]|uniref:type I DNA topoisomerase n=1 Tax=uncultured Helcococcus sp. TaxID=1072508 RepID=UPI002622615D|nr:type I DNA topoisomerase [uncultured Helcococcus sp.]